ncbi:hypothetical protein BU26DRAFT_109076 [Trematosphaeria pertusa]|uniref:Uncharacterized protein n=1 Tax=Trematosphaeria pertusa TaxID=390896 RepID=A0A6A6I005_9PLEO|nr:uncharacterized protein BU26DRAFT_109076 [Trematosphaeria pertusa]KAF2243785.1 hypothetical protein BU26DRAFT_109076 [Trematosphaeria pertusa]
MWSTLAVFYISVGHGLLWASLLFYICYASRISGTGTALRTEVTVVRFQLHQFKGTFSGISEVSRLISHPTILEPQRPCPSPHRHARHQVLAQRHWYCASHNFDYPPAIFTNLAPRPILCRHIALLSRDRRIAHAAFQSRLSSEPVEPGGCLALGLAECGVRPPIRQYLGSEEMPRRSPAVILQGTAS